MMSIMKEFIPRHLGDCVALCHRVLRIWFSGVFRDRSDQPLALSIRSLRNWVTDDCDVLVVAPDPRANLGNIGTVCRHRVLCPRVYGVLPWIPMAVVGGVRRAWMRLAWLAGSHCWVEEEAAANRMAPASTLNLAAVPRTDLDQI